MVAIAIALRRSGCLIQRARPALLARSLPSVFLSVCSYRAGGCASRRGLTRAAEAAAARAAEAAATRNMDGGVRPIDRHGSVRQRHG